MGSVNGYAAYVGERRTDTMAARRKGGRKEEGRTAVTNMRKGKAVGSGLRWRQARQVDPRRETGGELADVGAAQ